MKYHFALFAPLCLALVSRAQTYTAGGGLVPDDGSTVDFPIAITGLPLSLDTIAFGLETVCLDVIHTWVSDFEISLVAPDGTTVLLLNGVGGDTDAFTNTCLNNEATTNIADGSPPYTGTFRPQGQLGIVNNGQDGNGTWYMRVHDTYPFADEGSLLGFSLTFGSAPATYYALLGSSLPIVIINTGGVSVPNEPKIPGTMGIIDNGPGNVNLPTDPFNDFDGAIGIELRGNSSQWIMPKKSYSLELWDEFGADITEPLLGMPSESDWILSANYSDKSFLNNPLTNDLAQRLGGYAPRWRHVELILNGEYKGVYVFTEKIKRDNDRVDIAKLDDDDLAGDSLTGGYIVKIDWWAGDNTGGWASTYPPLAAANGQTVDFIFDYPGTPLPEQATYIQAYVDSFELALANGPLADTTIGYRHFLDVRSAIDLMLINELSRNVDGYRLSTFLHKEKYSKGGKLVLGPVWDYDIAWGNADYCRGADPTGWAYLFGDDCPEDGKQVPFWWGRFQEDEAFVDSARCRWEALRDNTLGIVRMHTWIDSMAAVLSGPQEHNFTVWPTLGEWVWPNPQPVPADFAGEIAELKNWISERWYWMDVNLPGHCSYAGFDAPDHHRAPLAFPVPFLDRFDVRLPFAPGSSGFTLFDALGRIVPVEVTATDQASTHWTVRPVHATTGMHTLRVRTTARSLVIPVLRAE